MKHEQAIIRKLVMTEKSTALSEANKYVLEVDRSANKTEIKKAVESLFDVKVVAVNTQRRKGESRMLRTRRIVKTPEIKRAIVTLKEGDRIDVV
jgi:large subunit ribosomal protein L23